MTELLMPVGGEPESECVWGDSLHGYLVDSGRSAIRLVLQSGFAGKRFLLPDYVCDAVPAVFDELKVRYDFYRLNPDLSIDADSVSTKEFDVLYVVDYFGCRPDYKPLLRAGTWVMEDCVFLPVVEKPAEVDRWIGFNSLRKVSPLADGSIVRATLALNEALIDPRPAPFCEQKYRAKRIKWEYLHDGAHSEQAYLDLFQRAEQMLDRQKTVHTMSKQSLSGLLDFLHGTASELQTRRENFRELDAHLRHYAAPIEPQFPCFYVLRVANRDRLREYLFDRRIFLPVHWPNVRCSDNPLYRTIISIPVDSRYGGEEMRRVAAAINAFYVNHAAEQALERRR